MYMWQSQVENEHIHYYGEVKVHHTTIYTLTVETKVGVPLADTHLKLVSNCYLEQKTDSMHLSRRLEGN